MLPCMSSAAGEGSSQDLCCLSKCWSGGNRWLWLWKGLSSAPRPAARLIPHSLPPRRPQAGTLPAPSPAGSVRGAAGLPGEAAPSHPLSSAAVPELPPAGCRFVSPVFPPHPRRLPHACGRTERRHPRGLCTERGAAGPAPGPPAAPAHLNLHEGAAVKAASGR